MSSGLQREVFALYRRALRMVRTKSPQAQPKFSLYVRFTFHTQTSSVSLRNVAAIEHLLRRGKRQIEMYENPSIKDCQISQAMVEWQQARRRDALHPSVVSDPS